MKLHFGRRDTAEPVTSGPELPAGRVAAPDTLLEIVGLKTHFHTTDGVVRAVDGVDLSVARGKTLCVVGESGCGKSITGRSVLQLVEPPGRIIDGQIRWYHEDSADPARAAHTNGSGWVDLTTLDPRGERMRRIRGAEIGMVFQEPMASLSPMYTVGDQLMETMRLHLDVSKVQAYERGVAQLRRVGIPQPEQRMGAYPFQLSGGMCQRVMIAIALSCDPALLIADEPTTALDVTTQARILDLLGDLKDETGMAMIFVTHDLGVVAEIADDVSVMYLGTVVEHGNVHDVFDNPKHPYTQALMRSVPVMGSGGRGGRGRLAAIRGMVPHPQNRPAGCPFNTRCEHAIAGLCDTTVPPVVSFAPGHRAACHLYAERPGGDPVPVTVLPPAAAAPAVVRQRASIVDTAPLLQVEDLTMGFPIRHGMFGRTTGEIRAVDGVDFTVRPGETLGLVGESGCGKTTLGRCIARALTPTGGRIRYRRGDGTVVDLANLGTRELRRYRREIRMIFQDPFSSLNPRMTLLQLVGEPLRTNGIATGSEAEDRVATMLAKVGLRPEYIRRYPHAFSGGERQRINIARALITEPRLVIADEAVSALDVSVRAQILNLLADLQDEFDLTYLFISHDLSVVEHLCNRVAVMYLGRIVETTDTATLYASPHHPYTEALMHAVPKADPHQRRARHEKRLPDDLPDPANPSSGCQFHTRCPHVRRDRCMSEPPTLRETGPGHHAACHHVESLTLSGVSGSAR